MNKHQILAILPPSPLKIGLIWKTAANLYFEVLLNG